MQVKAKLKYLRISPRKLRPIVNLIRGLDIFSAKTQLRFNIKKGAGIIEKLLDGAIANAENNFGLKKDNLYIADIRVEEGPTLKRWRGRAYGRAAAIMKRTSHLKLILEEKEEKVGAEGVKESREKKQIKVKGLGETEREKAVKKDFEKVKHLKSERISKKGFGDRTRRFFRRKSV